MSETERITRAAGVVSGATLVSRILGFVRDMVTAYFFGSGAATDAFFVAFRIPNLLRRLFAEGALSVAFIPVFTGYLSNRPRQEALDMARAVFTMLALTLLGVTALGEIFAPAIVSVMAPGFLDDPEKFRLTVTLTRITFPYIFFIGLVALCMGVLNSMNHFAAPALAPALLNVCMISGVYVWNMFSGDPVFGLAAGVVAGGAAQLLLQAPFMKRKGMSFRPNFNFNHPALKRILLLMGPAAMGGAVYQVNIIVGTLLASLLPTGSVSYLYYADRVVEFPLGVFAIALGTAALPSMSRHTAENNMAGLVESFSHSMRLVMFISIPSTAGLIVLGRPIVEVLFQRGAFDHTASIMTIKALVFYTLGLWAFSAVKILAAAFFAMQDTKTPLKVAALAFAANIGFSLALMGPLKHGGLALATSLAAMLNVGVLIYLLRIRLGLLDGRHIVRTTIKTSLASLAMAGVLYFCGHEQWPVPGVVKLPVLVAAGFLVFVLAARLLRLKELNDIGKIFLRRGKRGVSVPAEKNA